MGVGHAGCRPGSEGLHDPEYPRVAAYPGPQDRQQVGRLVDVVQEVAALHQQDVVHVGARGGLVQSETS